MPVLVQPQLAPVTRVLTVAVRDTASGEVLLASGSFLVLPRAAAEEEKDDPKPASHFWLRRRRR